jgi:hypothetical protein
MDATSLPALAIGSPTPLRRVRLPSAYTVTPNASRPYDGRTSAGIAAARPGYSIR